MAFALFKRHKEAPRGGGAPAGEDELRRKDFVWDNGVGIEDITAFTVSYGDFPCVHIQVNGEELVCERRIDPRDGGMHLPEDFFRPQRVPLSRQQYGDILAALKAAEIQWLTTSEIRIRNYLDRVCGNSPSDTLRCTFRNGKQFLCLELPYNVWSAVTKAIEGTVGRLDALHSDDEPEGETEYTGELTRMMETECCGLLIPADCKFCPSCGKPADPVRFLDAKRDLSETGWGCRCGGFVGMRYLYCPYCGSRRPF